MALVDEMKVGHYMAKLYNNITLRTCNLPNSMTNCLFLA
jgi:hypothetical protein